MTNSGVTNFTDARQHPRSKLEMLVGVIRGGKFGFEYSMQIGEGGMLLEVYSPCKAGETLEVSFFMPPAGELILIKGEVVYALEPGNGRYLAGVRFLNATPATRNVIRKYVEMTTKPNQPKDN